MVRSKNNRRQPKNPRPGRSQQPYAHQRDLQEAGDHTTDRSDLQTNIMDGDWDYTHDPQGKSRVRARFRISNGGDLSPMALAAVIVGASVFFMLVGCVLALAGEPGWAFGVIALASLQFLAAAGLALYESRTRRLASTAAPRPEIGTAGHAENQTTVTALIVQPTELNVKPETILRQPPTEKPATPRALDSGES